MERAEITHAVSPGGDPAVHAVADRWTSALVWVDAVAVLFLLAGGVYHELIHLLFGSLVGLITLVVAIHLWRVERRNRVRWTGIGALVLVIVQGILGGFRMTGGFPLGTSPERVAADMYLAGLHSVLGQVLFVILVALAVVTSRRWQGNGGIALPAERRDRGMADALVILVVAQLALGAVRRHLAEGLTAHIAVATVVAVTAIMLGARMWRHHRDVGLPSSLGKLLIVLASVQVLLGFGAYVTTVAPAGGKLFSRTYEMTVAAAHQWFGALLLACAVTLTLWLHRVEQPA